jgi:hypothetical protein
MRGFCSPVGGFVPFPLFCPCFILFGLYCRHWPKCSEHRAVHMLVFFWQTQGSGQGFFICWMKIWHNYPFSTKKPYLRIQCLSKKLCFLWYRLLIISSSVWSVWPDYIWWVELKGLILSCIIFITIIIIVLLLFSRAMEA